MSQAGGGGDLGEPGPVQAGGQAAVRMMIMMMIMMMIIPVRIPLVSDPLSKTAHVGFEVARLD